MALTIQQIQNNITAKNDAREIINQLADYIQANPGGGSSYLVYTAMLTQANADPPIAAVLENTATTDTWGRTNVGKYRIKIATGQDLRNKLFIPGQGNWAGDSTTTYPVTDFNGTIVGYVFITPQLDSGDTYVFIETIDITGNDAEWSTLVNGASTMAIDFRVYP